MLEGIIRESVSKAAAKALRKDGYLIANIYGKGQPNIHCAFKVNDFIRSLKAKDHVIFPVKVGGKELRVVVQEYQRDPVTNAILHVDLMLAQHGIEARYSVPMEFSGTPKGLKDKGALMISKKRIRVKCTPEKLPTHFALNIAPLGVGDSLLVRDIAPVDGVRILDRADVAVVGVVKSR
ncbi:MAG: 50S ribosomal protein L25/general stress protein Ctc [Helicobacter sp.]|nr:50S ribosomal protein L25/general stress protein Ctc [Helicobacter sp.]MBD5167698.1 50S ribosomal protein L25/general stress protein Ctc [Helicobacter sp.]MDE5817554.1 50S ribosomal protein L25/general stress protein Ctc [Helicobacter sp.]MDE6045061.1 50S ribosomal protein L25/general stress protein Ctc [Helicobacter sp.]MDE7197100.1 50S ribosomal protein L25/general stress protein Ctc [Helicobacter sp.]